MEKRITYSNKDGDELVGILTRGDADACILFSHGFLSDKDENTLFSSLSETLGKQGFSSFRFDYTGHGESADRPLDLERMQSDFDASANFLKSLGYDSVYFLGHSLGAVPVLRSSIVTEQYFLLAPYYKPDKRRVSLLKEEFEENTEEITLTNRFDVDHRLPLSFLEDMSDVDLVYELENLSSKTNLYLSNSDNIMPDNYYKDIMDFDDSFNNVLLLNTDHFFSKNRETLYDSILSIIEN